MCGDTVDNCFGKVLVFKRLPKGVTVAEGRTYAQTRYFSNGSVMKSLFARYNGISCDGDTGGVTLIRDTIKSHFEHWQNETDEYR